MKTILEKEPTGREKSMSYYASFAKEHMKDKRRKGAQGLGSKIPIIRKEKISLKRTKNLLRKKKIKREDSMGRRQISKRFTIQQLLRPSFLVFSCLKDDCIGNRIIFFQRVPVLILAYLSLRARVLRTVMALSFSKTYSLWDLLLLSKRNHFWTCLNFHVFFQEELF